MTKPQLPHEQYLAERMQTLAPAINEVINDYAKQHGSKPEYLVGGLVALIMTVVSKNVSSGIQRIQSFPPPEARRLARKAIAQQFATARNTLNILEPQMLDLANQPPSRAN